MISDQRSSQAQLRVSERHQPRPAICLFRMTYSGQRPIEELLDKTEGVFQFEATNVGAPDAGQVRQFRTMPPQPQLLGEACALGQPLHLDEDERASHERSRTASSALGMILRDGMQVAPGTHLDLTVLGVLGDILLIWFEPCGRVSAREFVSMPWGASVGCLIAGLGVKAASCSQAREG